MEKSSLDVIFLLFNVYEIFQAIIFDTKNIRIYFLTKIVFFCVITFQLLFGGLVESDR